MEWVHQSVDARQQWKASRRMAGAHHADSGGPSVLRTHVQQGGGRTPTYTCDPAAMCQAFAMQTDAKHGHVC